MNEYILPMKTKPIVLCYHNLAFPLCFIQGNAEKLGRDILPWAIGKYLNCVFNEVAYHNRYEICMYDWWGIEDQVVYHQHINMFKKIFTALKIDILHYIKMLIDQNCYVSGYFNEKHIPGKAAFRANDYYHDYIIYGYSDNKQVLYSVGYLANRKFLSFEIPFENYLDSLFDCDSDRIEFNIWNYNSDFQFHRDDERIRCCLSDYITSSNSYGVKEDCTYGINANKRLKDFIYERASRSGKNFIDDRYTRAFLEQKYFHYMCAKHLQNEKIVYLSNEYIELIDKTYQRANNVYLLSIKYNMTHDKSLLHNIVKGFDDIDEMERITIPKILDSYR